MKSKIAIIALVLACTFLTVFFVQKNKIVNSQSVHNHEKIEGVYEFISEEADLTKPTKEKYTMAPPEWQGIWQIQKGYLSKSLMASRGRKQFDCKERDFGYETFAGKYTIEGDEIRFIPSYSLNPISLGRTIRMKIEIKNDTLILTQKLTPIIEDTREGTIKITLKKLE